MKHQDLANEVTAIMTLCSTYKKSRSFLAATLREEHFYDPRTKELYVHIMALASRRKKMPTYKGLQHSTALTTESKELLDEGSFPAVKAEGDAEQVLEVLEKMRQGRVILSTYDAVMEVMNEEKADPDDAFALLETGLLTARTSQTDSDLNIGKDGNYLEAVAALLNRKRPNTVPTGFYEFDNAAGGLPRGGLTTLAASSGGGKSCMAVQICVNAFHAGYSCAIVTLEMSKEQTVGRLSANLSGVSYTAINLAKLDESQKTRISRASAALQKEAEEGKKALDIKHRSQMTFSEIALEMRALNYDVIVIDYINLLDKEADGNKGQNDAAILGDIAKAAKGQASASNAAWIMLAQLNEQGDVKYSKAIKENSDVMLTWTYGEAERESHLVEISIQKARHSAGFKFPLRENFGIQRFENLGGSGQNTDVAVRKSKRKKAQRHPTAKPMPGLAFDDEDDGDDL